MVNNIYMITEYKGFTIIKGHDWKFHVYDGKRFIISQDTYRLAQESILKITRLGGLQVAAVN